MMRLRPKIMYGFMIRSFIPLLVMTLLVCWFVVLMQFLWQHVDDMVGKGLAISVLLEVLWYAALYVLPTAVPLGVLLASLMTFGNLGERLELLAMKSAGVPLSKIMKPLIVLVSCIAIGLFVYLDRGVQVASVKVYQILFSARYARPELEIPQGIFFNGIDGYSIYVEHKDPKTGVFHNLMIYDLSDNSSARIILADTGRLVMDDSKLFMTMTLRSGESFEQLGKESVVPGANEGEDRPASYIKEYFAEKIIFIPFDANFELMGDDYLKSQFVGKNLRELIAYSDSTRVATDSVGRAMARSVLSEVQLRIAAPSSSPTIEEETSPRTEDLLSTVTIVPQHKRLLASGERIFASSPATVPPAEIYTLDTLLDKATNQQKLTGYKTAIEWLNALAQSAQTANSYYDTTAADYRVNAQEMHRKFTFPVACLLFFFVGAPLGAIVRKGGVGTPMVLAVIIFIIYYVIDTFGLKMINSGEIPVWIGMWLSSAMILPLGAFLTYKASRDSATLNADAYIIFLRKIFAPDYQRSLEYKEIIITPSTPEEIVQQLTTLRQQVITIQSTPYARSHGLRLDRLPEFARAYTQIYEQLHIVEETLHNYPDKYVFSQLLALPRIGRSLRAPWVQHRTLMWIVLPLLPLSIPLLIYWAVALRRNKPLLAQMPSLADGIVHYISDQSDIIESDSTAVALA